MKPSRGNGANDYGRYNWAGLLAFIGEANWGTLRQVETTLSLVNPDKVGPVKETVGTYGRVLGTEAVEDWHGQATSSAWERGEK